MLPLLLDSFQDYALFLMDTQGQIVTWTPGVGRLLGFEESEFLGLDASVIFTEDDRRNRVPETELHAAMQFGRAEDVRWHQRRDGTLFWANGQMLALRDEGGELRGFAKILRDETRHKHNEDALRETRERLQTALDVGHVGTWEWDIQKNRVVADRNLARFFGLLDQEAVGSPVERFLRAVHPDDLARVGARIDEAVRECDGFIADYRILQPGDEVLWVEARGQVQPDAQGRAAFLNGVMLDISERKRSEAALRQSEARYRTLFDAMDNGFCVLEVIFDEGEQPVDYRFVEVNPAFEKQTGLRDAAGKRILELVPDLDRIWIENYGRVVKTGEPAHFQDFDSAMERAFEVHAFRFSEPEQKRVAVLFTDITARKRGEDAIREAHAKAEETNRMKDEFMAVLSHELRTPLNAILGWANILRLNELDSATQMQGLETIERNARAQSALINDLLDVSRILTGKMRLELRPLVLCEVLEGAINTVTPAMNAKGIELERDIDHGAGQISGDANRLSQVFWNVLSNAIKFTPTGGRIWVSLQCVDEQIQVQIRDNGAGIAPEFLSMMFERFRQADASSTRAFGGLGIGLALVRHLVESHGGTVRAQSEGAGRGATFTLSFPLKNVQSTTSISVPAPEVLVSAPTIETNRKPKSGAKLSLLAGLRVLVVDDEADARQLVKLSLEQHGVTVEFAEDAASAFALVEANSFDVLLSDIAMPAEDGHSLVRRIRAREETSGGFLPAIALTAYANPADRVNALMAGFQVHLAKPVDPLELAATVASLKARF